MNKGFATRAPFCSDITQLPVNAIVNAANSSLIRGGGVCGAIFRAAGHELTAACVAIGASIAFPAISTGIYSYPLQAATEIAVRTAREFAAEAGSLTTVHFACFSDEVLRAYTGLGVAEAAGLAEPS